MAILSAYDEFPLVKKALQYGAIDYILKAEMNVGDISGIIEKAQKLKSQDGAPAAAADTAQERCRLLADYMENGGADDRTFLLRLGLRQPLEAMALMAFRMEPGSGADLARLEQGCPDQLVLVPWRDLVIAFLCRRASGVQYSPQKRAMASGCLAYLRQQPGCAIQAWSTVLNCQETGICLAVQTCRDVVNYKYYYGLENFDQVLYHGRGEGGAIAQFPLYRQFFEAAGHFQAQEAERLLRRCLDTLHEGYTHPADIKRHISVMCHKLLSDISMIETGGSWFDTVLLLLHEIEDAPTKQSREEALERFLEQYGIAISATSTKRSPAVIQAVAYIDGHYTEKITLEQIAAQSYVNNTYMSELFKKETGVTLNDYINNLRVIRACECLRFSDDSMGEIAEQCGFSDQNYFTKVFKKILHTTPSAYRGNLKRS